MSATGTDRAPRPPVLAVVSTAVVFGALDALWLGVLSGDLYTEQLGHLLAASGNPWAAAAFYVVFVAGLVHFVVRPALAREGLGRSVLEAAAFGLVTYGTFDLTSMAVFRDFPLVVVLADLAWGAVLCAVTTAAVVTLVRSRRPPAERAPGRD
ncbi:DUF2177 family protein [Phycicoccus sp. CSK15P-2]|uniref:DUF2177 family protein n=1 Tax=Phycicoccus sp. CSK15P-2 TaxID=2807627 RepID=UPI00195261EE|nr:DUF2177 family protein [Phycicoccus sp. CSK15P-2]MBM6403065.1 DUF2177 family protein [Phycicoccus sp. CSK15P-2]